MNSIVLNVFRKHSLPIIRQANVYVTKQNTYDIVVDMELPSKYLPSSYYFSGNYISFDEATKNGEAFIDEVVYKQYRPILDKTKLSMLATGYATRWHD